MGITAQKTIRPGYKQTAVGVIPEDWDHQHLGELAQADSPICYGIVQPGPFIENGIPVLAIKNLNTDYRTDVHRSSSRVEKPYVRSRVLPGDVLISVKGTTGRVGKVPEHFRGNISRDLARIRLSDDNVPEFWFQMLQSDMAQRSMEIATVGTTRLELSIGILRQIVMVRPPRREQCAIAEVLEDADALLNALTQLIAKKRDLKQATMQQLLTGKRRLPGFSAKWEVKRLGDIADVDPENLGSDTNPAYSFKYISLEDVDTGTLRGYTEQIFGTSPSRARRKVRKGDVLVSTVRPNLKSHLLIRDVVSDTVCSTGFSVVRCKPTVADPAFVYFHLFTGGIEQQIESLLTGSNYPAINRGDVKALRIPCSLLAEQRAIATVLSDMDTEIAALEGRRKKTQVLKQGMMQQLLTGKIRLI